MIFTVEVSREARRDLGEIAEYIADNDSTAMADHVLVKIGEVLDSLSESPHRGAHPPELVVVSNPAVREIFFKPYRVIYQVVGRKVSVLLIADGRRDLHELLQRRLLGA
jgi:toxin ParE1/3/4